MLVSKERGNELLDYYSDLLTNHQVNILKDYFEDDLSMMEISENYEISKSAVQDLISRSLKQLENYEKSLHLIENNTKIKLIIEEMCNSNDVSLKQYGQKLNKIIRR